MIPTVEWKDGAVRILDQSRLPGQVTFVDCSDYGTVASAIRELKVRGAPAIGVTAAMGVALGAQHATETSYETFRKEVTAICDHLAATRPTAVNLFWSRIRTVRSLSDWIHYVGKDHLHHRLERVLGSRLASIGMIFGLTICLGLAAMVLRKADTAEAILLLTQASLIVIMITILEHAGRR